METLKRNLFEILIAVEFIVLILLSFVFFNRVEGKASKAENRYLAAFPELKTRTAPFPTPLPGSWPHGLKIISGCVILILQ